MKCFTGGRRNWLKNCYLVSPSQGLLKYLAGEYVKLHPDDFNIFQERIFIFPSRRAGMFFRYYVKRELMSSGSSIILPRIYAFEDFIDEFSIWHDPNPPMHFFDQVWHLYKVLKEKVKGISVLNSFEKFIPWGVQLVAAFEEIEREGIIIPEGLNLPEGYPLMISLSEIWQLWREKIKDEGKSTPGMRHRTCIERWQEKMLPEFIKESEVHFIGFTTFKNAEKAFFKILVNVTVWVESDPEDFPEENKNILRQLGFNIEIIGAEKSEGIAGHGPKRPAIYFYEVPDRHHALERIAELIDESPEEPDRIAVVVPDEGAVIPLIYKLSSLDRDIHVNITLGYPLSRSLVASFVLGVLELHSYRSDDGRFYVPAFIHLLRHPYSRILFKALLQGGKTSTGQEEKDSYRSPVSSIESFLRDYGSPYMDHNEMENLIEESCKRIPEEREKRSIIESFTLFRKNLFENFESLSPLTIRSVFEKVRTVLERIDQAERVISENDKSVSSDESHRVSLEQTFRERFIEDILKPIIGSSWAGEAINSIYTVYKLLKELLSVIRVPFSGSPIRGLQILGFIDSNLLTFDKVIILDANEGVLPPARSINTFLPEGLRKELNLQTRETETTVNRFIFRRLIKSSREAHIFYTSMSSIQRTSRNSLSGPSSSIRSRFVEELIWELNKTKRSLEESVITVPVRIPYRIINRHNRIEKKNFSKILEKISQWKLSASFFNTYLKCPVMFFYRYVLKLGNYRGEMEEGLEGRGYRELGDILHKTMRRYLEKVNKISDIEPSEIVNVFKDIFSKSDLFKRLGKERRFFIEETASYRLVSYLKWLKKKRKDFEVKSLEEEVTTTLRFSVLSDKMDVVLTGRIDLMGTYNEEIWIVDYKSGALFSPKFNWDGISKISEAKENFCDDDAFLELRKFIGDLQLPFYGFIVCKEGRFDPKKPIRACYHILGSGEPDGYQIEMREDVREISGIFEKVLNFLICHILLSSAFIAPDDAGICPSCDYLRICPYSPT